MHKLIIAISLFFIAGQSMAQNGSTEDLKYRKFALYLGAGPSYFINNVVTFKNEVNSFNYEISFRAMWEPKHSFLSLGFESGYYRLYSVSVDSIKSKVVNTAIPLQLVVSMKVAKNWYANFSFGQSILYNKVTTELSASNHSNHTLSYADLGLTAGYRFSVKNRLSYAVETKFFYSSGNADGTVAVLFMVGYKL